MTDEEKPIVFAQVAPTRDLWPDIEPMLDQQVAPQAARPQRHWLAAIAASLVVAVSLFAMQWQPEPTALQQRALAMQAEHRERVADLQQTLGRSAFDATLSQLAVAEHEVLAAINIRGDDPALLRMLARVHQHRIALLMTTLKTRNA